MRLLPNIPLVTVAHWPFQGHLSDISGNGLDVITLNTFTALTPGGVEQYQAMDACTQGFAFDGNTKLVAPNSAALRMTGPFTIQFDIIQQTGGSGTSCWFSCADPAGRSGGAAPDRIGSLFTFFFGNLTAGGHPYYTDENHGSNLPTTLENNWATTAAQWEGFNHAVAFRYNGGGSVDLFLDGVKQMSAVSTLGGNTAAGTERFYIGGCEGSNQGPYNQSAPNASRIADMRVLSVARSDADLAADAAYSLAACAGREPLAPATGTASPVSLIGAAATGHHFRYAPKVFGDQFKNPGES